MHFHDRHEWITYLKATEVARRLRADPSMIDGARAFLARFMAPDPHQREYTRIWQELLERDAAEIAAALTEDSPRGQLLRETSPVFGNGLTSREGISLSQ